MSDPVMLLSQLHGEGRVTFRALTAAGFHTLGAIAQSPVQHLADRAHLSSGTARRLKGGAEDLIGKGVGLHTATLENGSLGSGRAARRRRAAAPAANGELSEGVGPEEASLLMQVDPPPDGPPDDPPDDPPPGPARPSAWSFG